MPLRPVEQLWKKQPPNDPAPLAPWVSFDVVARQSGVTVYREGSADRTYGPGGLGWYGSGSAGAYIIHPVTKQQAAVSETLVLACMFSSITASGSLITLGVSSNGFGGYFMIQHNAGGLSVAVDDAANAAGGNHVSTENFLDGKVHCAVAMHKTDGVGSYRRLWVDGRLIASGYVGGFSSTTYDRFCLNMLRRNASGSFAGSGNRVYAGLYAKGLTEEQAQVLSARGLWAGAYPARRLLVPFTEGGGGSGALFEYLSEGGILLSGSAAQEGAYHYSQQGSGGLIFLGSGSAAEANFYNQIAQGGLTLSGQATALPSSSFVLAGSGGLSFAGTATILESNLYSQVASGGLLFSGEASVAGGANYAVNATGGLTIAGAAAAVETNLYILIASGGLLLSGQASVDSASGFSVQGAGGLAFLGSAAATKTGAYVQVGAGGIAFAGDATEVTASNWAAYAAGGMQLSGSSVSSVSGGSGGVSVSAEEVAAAVLAALQATTIPVDVRKMNGAAVIGTGTTANKWRGVDAGV